MWDTIGVWVEAVALIAIFVLELKEYKRQGRERREEEDKTRKQFEAMQRQMVATEQAARAAQDTALVQKASMQQWVDFEKWTVTRDPTDLNDFSLKVATEIVNPTQWPMKLLYTNVQIGQRSRIGLIQADLTPNKPYQIELCHAVLKEGDKQRKFLLGRPVLFLLYGIVHYRDCFGEEKEYNFTGELLVSKEEISFTRSYLPNNPLKQPSPNAAGDDRR